jgi:hypothetical protein
MSNRHDHDRRRHDGPIISPHVDDGSEAPPQVTMVDRVPAATERRARTCLTTGLFQSQDTRLE